MADIREHPWLLSLREDNIHRCGASLIKSNKALTAGHCYNINIPILNYSIYAGSTYRKLNGESVQIARIDVHPDFDYDKMINDIAIISLMDQLKISEFIQPVVLAKKNEILPNNTNGMIAGWGLTYESEPYFSVDLWETTLPIIANDICKQTFGVEINERVFCAGTLNSGSDANFGDSGGPLIVQNKQFGIISWGLGGSRTLFIGIYTRIAAYRDWIDLAII